jgi:alkanesulfonate monooxygenase SsuD/methylene tetrahydromethanopterin reductase-like flavin-dependent oxidoreductase (luciferase family)
MKPIRFNAFVMNTAGHQSPGLWRHPDDQSARYKELRFWTDLAQTLERGGFDSIFFADVMGVYDVYRGTADGALGGAVQVPVNDPMLLIAAMAAVTRDLGFAVTFTLTYEHPVPFASHVPWWMQRLPNRRHRPSSRWPPPRYGRTPRVKGALLVSL